MLGTRAGFGMQPILMGKSGVDLSTRGATGDVDPVLRHQRTVSGGQFGFYQVQRVQRVAADPR